MKGGMNVQSAGKMELVHYAGGTGAAGGVGAGNESRMESHFIPWLDLKSTWKVKISCKFKLFQNA